MSEFFSNKLDVEAAVQAVKKQFSFINTPSYQENGAKFMHIPLEECDRFDFQSDDYFRCYIKYFGAGNSTHPVGTSKMGPHSDPDAVVDPHLKVRNIRGLRQVDAGIFPTSLYGNTNAAVVMVAEKVSDMIKLDYGYIETGTTINANQKISYSILHIL
ncbi:glucose dehydrogenase [FAD, quinone]-like [Contarinia nasturtii]|uniref:glucose dehydrogenase [FAD, quinone]-like n=1 Tax=Contarinia nasturtii TaxID=265458 RepID=UPI0012D48FBC|nr:glucose dehydrogenase [FAD, quinone]-like [Contarinia nasturtii]